jgi:phosphoglycolate phosphatase
MQGHKTVTLEEYRTYFTFPVFEYYKKVGFVLPPEGKDDFAELAKYFVERYRENFGLVKVFPDLLAFLNKHKGKKSLICLSATKQTELLGQVKMAGVDKHFDHIVGVSDIYAAGKVDVAKNFFSKTHLDPKKTLFIGDTVHDAEVAKELGANIVLVSRGHQSKEVLMKGTDCLILDSLEEVKKYIE